MLGSLREIWKMNHVKAVFWSNSSACFQNSGTMVISMSEIEQ